MSGRAEIHHQHRDVTGGWLRPSVIDATDGLSNFALLKCSPRQTPEDSSRPGVSSTRRLQTLLLGDSPSGPAHAGFLAPTRAAGLACASSAPPAVSGTSSLVVTASAGDTTLALPTLQELREQGLLPIVRAWSPSPGPPIGGGTANTKVKVIALDEWPSPTVVAVSFLSFSVGAVLPLLPYVLGARELVVSAVVSCLTLFAAGALVSAVTARSWWFSGLRQLAVGGVAAAVTFGVGNLIGAAGV